MCTYQRHIQTNETQLFQKKKSKKKKSDKSKKSDKKADKDGKKENSSSNITSSESLDILTRKPKPKSIKSGGAAPAAVDGGAGGVQAVKTLPVSSGAFIMSLIIRILNMFRIS